MRQIAKAIRSPVGVSVIRRVFGSVEASIDWLSPMLTLAMAATLLTPGTAGAAVEENIKVPIVGDVFDDICGETLIHTSGNLHIKFSFTENDNRISGTFHFQPQAAKLVCCRRT